MEYKVAVIGMAGRFPGGETLSAFYRQLRQGVRSIGDITEGRIQLTTLPKHRQYQRRGFLNRVDLFDHKFFQIAAGEAQHMDPHQRMLIETVHECMEDAGYDPDALSGSNTAVYVANSAQSYYRHAEEFAPTLVTGNASEFLAARLNRVFNLTGAVAVVDTSCSSGLVALHQACNELLLGNADQAIVCAANIELFPFLDAGQHIEVDSPDGNSIPFSDASNGMVYGEAVVAILLKRLDKALTDNDNIHAIIRASAVNNNASRSASLTAPDSFAQAEVILRAWRKADIDPTDLGFIEAHGSGTQLGDSLEVAGLNIAFSNFRTAGKCCPISTVKANIGHSRSAAGLAGLVKTILSLKKREVFPAIYTGRPSPHINFDNASVYITETLAPMKVGKDGSCLAAISSMGFSGTNCHVVLQENRKEDSRQDFPKKHLVMLSCWHLQGLLSHAQDLIDLLTDEPHPCLEDLAFTLAVGRKHYKFRQSFVAGSIPELQELLTNFIQSNGSTIKLPPQKPVKTIFLFTGEASKQRELAAGNYGSEVLLVKSQTREAKERTASAQNADPAIQEAAFELTVYEHFCDLGLRPDKIVGTGAGKALTAYINKQLSFEEMLAQLAGARDDQATDISPRAEKMIEKECHTGTPFFISVDKHSRLYSALDSFSANTGGYTLFSIQQHAWLKQDLQIESALYNAGYLFKPDFFSAFAGQRISLPPRPFAKTRCWIREDVHPALRSGIAATGKDTPDPVAPFQTDSLGKLLTTAWNEVLPAPISSTDTHFFEAGGDSLTASKMINAVRKKLEVSISFEDIFDFPRFGSFRDFIAGSLSITDNLLLIWKEVLKTEELTTSDNFFELGGHSLIANHILNRIRQLYPLKVDFEDFFKYPTIDGFAGLLEGRLGNQSLKPESRIIPWAPPSEDYPLSHAQKRLWILDQLSDHKLVAYNEGNVFELYGPVDDQLLAAAFRQLVERHEVLRTTFQVRKGEPRQVILDDSDAYEMQLIDLSQQSDRAQSVAMQIADFAKRPFDLQNGPLIKATLFILEKNKRIIAINVHHIIIDQWSFKVLIRDLHLIYSQLQHPSAAALPPLRIQYKDFACWSASRMDSPEFTEHEAYWKRTFAGTISVLDLQLVRQRSLERSYEGSALGWHCSTSLSTAISALSARNGTTNFITLYALLNLFLSKYCHQQEIVLGTPVLGREFAELEDQLGMFANTVALRARLYNDRSLSSLLADARELISGAFQHQAYPFDLLIEKLSLPDDRTRFPLFDVMIVYRNERAANPAALDGDLVIRPFSFPVTTSKFDLSFYFMETGDSLRFDIIYRCDIFDEAGVREMGDDLLSLMEQAITADHLPLSAISEIENRPGATRHSDNAFLFKGYIVEPVTIEENIRSYPEVDEARILLHPAGRPGGNQLVGLVTRKKAAGVARPDNGRSANGNNEEGNDTVGEASEEDLALIRLFQQTEKPLPLDRLIPDYVRHWAIQDGQKTAVRFGPAAISYANLHQLVERATAGLSSLGVKKGDVLAVYCRRGPHLLISLLAIFRTGAVYLPLGMDFPLSRVRTIVLASGATMILTDKETFTEPRPLITLDELTSITLAQPIEDLLTTDPAGTVVVETPDPDALAYIIYTSGSTGSPKGAMIEQKGMMNHLFAKIEALHMDRESIVIQNAPQSFDISIWQLLAGLVCGATVCIYPDKLLQNIGNFIGALERDQPTIIEMVPSFANTFLAIKEEQQRCMDWNPAFALMTGETLLPALVNRWFTHFPNTTLVNAYGPTEASDDITHHFLTEYDPAENLIPIGRAIRNMKIHILNALGRPVPIGAVGEIYVSGVGVGQGYINDPGRTAASFITFPDNPSSPEPTHQLPEIMYRTGDRGRYRPDGTIEFYGRLDAQVKINGNRIETGEIEHCLSSIEEVRQAVVLPFPNDQSGYHLAAFVITDDATVNDCKWIKQRLLEKLPAYMVPAIVVFTDAFPITSNGKIDRRLFSDPVMAISDLLFIRQLQQTLHEKMPGVLVPQTFYIVPSLPGRGQEAGLLATESKKVKIRLEHELEVPPATDDQRVMLSIWTAVLNRPIDWINTNFFEWGGDSLKAMKLIAQTEEKFGRAITLRDVFSHPTVEKLCKLLEEQPVAEQEHSSAIPVLKPAEAASHYPVSFAQRRMWLLDRMGQAGYAYNIPGALVLSGSLDTGAWKIAWQLLLQRHEILRTAFELRNGEPVQVIAGFDTGKFGVDFLDWTGENEQDQRISTFIDDESHFNFDLQQAPLVRASMIRLSPQRWLFVFTLHHILADEWSLGILGKDLIHFYQALRQGTSPSLSPLAIQYKDFSSWQTSLPAEYWQSKREFWYTRLKGELPILQLPLDAARPPVQTYAGKSLTKLLKGAGGKWEKMAATEGVTLFMQMLAVTQTLLHRLTGQSDLIIGSPVSGRHKMQLQEQAGLYLNSIVFREKIDGMASFATSLTNAKTAVIDAFANEDYPFDKLVDELDLPRDFSRSPVFDCMLVVHESVTDIPVITIDDLSIRPFERHSVESKFDLTIHCRKIGEDLFIGINYNLALFHDDTIHRWLQLLAQIMEEVLQDRAILVAHCGQPRGEQLQRLLEWSTGPDMDFPTGHYHPLFCQAAERFTHRPAVYFNGGAWSYGWLRNWSGRMATYLSDRYGLRKGQVVGIYKDGSAEVIGAVLAIWQCGGVCLPIDPQLPDQRIQFVLTDSGAEFLLTDKPIHFPTPNLIVCEWPSDIQLHPQEQPAPWTPSPDQLAYIAYPTGYTGNPKGVMIEHRGLVNNLYSRIHRLGLDQHSVVAQLAAESSGISIQEMFAPLLCGASIRIFSAHKVTSAENLLRSVAAEEISILQVDATYLDEIVRLLSADPVALPLAHLRFLLTAGHEITPVLRQRWFALESHITIVSAYGVAEAGGDVTVLVFDAPATGKRSPAAIDASVGRPLPHLRVYVVDAYGGLCPQGIIGEIQVSGVGVGRGYTADPANTLEVFGVDPFRPGNFRLFHTGDRGRWNESGLLELIVRKHGLVEVEGTKTPTEEVPDHHPPATRLEEVLVDIFARVLGREQIGMEMDFFRMGGDSIKAIQISSRLHREGYQLDVRDIFAHPILADLSKMVRSVLRQADQSAVTGEIILTPMQQDFLYSDFKNKHHYNQAVLLQSRQRFDAGIIRKTLGHLLHHHDALRVHFECIDAIWQQYNEAPERWEEEVTEVDLRGKNNEYLFLEQALQELQESLALDGAWLIKAAVFHLTEGDRLFVLAHHLLVDGLSWRILLEDLTHLVQQDAQGLLPDLPAKTDSLQKWTRFLSSYAQSDLFLQEHNYWLQKDYTDIDKSWRLLSPAEQGHSGTGTLNFGFDAERTRQLLEDIHHAYGTGINDILLTAVSATLSNLLEQDDVWINIEGHGREPMHSGIDITRTVGWFTSIYPLILPGRSRNNAGRHLSDVKESLRQIPMQGCGFGLLCYRPEYRSVWARRADILFNYLGQFDTDLDEKLFEAAPGNLGATQGKEEAETHGLLILGMIAGGRLHIELLFDRSRYGDSAMHSFQLAFTDSLIRLIEHCSKTEEHVLTPSDLGYKGLSIDELENIFD